MRLSPFILAHLEAILQAWEDFARSVNTPTQALDPSGLRDHAEYILRTVAVDLQATQNVQQQIAKSEGRAPSSGSETPAQTHAVLRLMAGFTLDQMVSEYRALRSSVLRLWLAEAFSDHQDYLDDMVRFNEAIDQALAESIASYGHAVETTRKTVLAVLGHDLRTPLSAVLMGADLLRKTQQLASRERTIAAQIAISVRRANQMVNDLLDLARCNLGTGLPVRRELTELNGICRSIVDELAAGHPHAQILFPGTEKVVGRFDATRMAQVFSNLIGNAVRHGHPQLPIQVRLTARNGVALFTVHNGGEPIPAADLPFLFNPEGRYSRYSNQTVGAAAGLGLGLFIAAEIVTGHSGTIQASSSKEHGTVFEVTLPVT